REETRHSAQRATALPFAPQLASISELLAPHGSDDRQSRYASTCGPQPAVRASSRSGCTFEMHCDWLNALPLRAAQSASRAQKVVAGSPAQPTNTVPTTNPM